jgi:hypothetical protein
MRPAAFGFGLAVVAFSFAACGKHSNSTTPVPVPTATVTPVSSPAPSSSPCVLQLGVAYEPDGGNGNGFNGVQVVHFQNNDDNLCPAQAISSTPAPVFFQSSVGGLAFSSELTEGVALLQSTSGGYPLVQALFGALPTDLVPIGVPYNVAQQPSPVPSGVTLPVPVIPNVTSVQILDQSSTGGSGVALTVGPAASPPAIVALTSLQNAPPQYGSFVPFFGSNYTDKGVLPGPYSIIRLSPDQSNVLTRGPQALETFAITAVGTGYEFNAEAHDATLGYGSATVLRGNGNIAYDPADSTRVLIGGNSSGNANLLYLIDGLPGAITHIAQLAMPGAINSIQIAGNGTYAIVGTSTGIVVVNGVNTNSLSFVAPFDRFAGNASAIPYVDCTGTARKMSDVFSVGLSAGLEPNTTNNFLVALGTSPGVVCPSGHNAAVAALPFNTGTGSTPAPTATPTATPKPTPTAKPSPGASPAPTPSPTPSPIPTLFYQNNVVAPPAGADYLIVR